MSNRKKRKEMAVERKKIIKDVLFDEVDRMINFTSIKGEEASFKLNIMINKIRKEFPQQKNLINEAVKEFNKEIITYLKDKKNAIND